MKNKTITLTYNSITELTNKVHLKPSKVNEGTNLADMFKTDERKSEKDSLTWYGLPNAKPSDVIKAVNSGYSEGLKAIQQAGQGFEIPPVKSVRRIRTRGDQGDNLDITRVYSGNLESAWSRTHKEQGFNSYGKNITIAVDIGANCGVNSDALKWRGAYASALADKYSTAGYIVEVFAYVKTNNSYEKNINGEFILKVLDSSEPFDLEKLANTICFAGFFRTFVFEAFLTADSKVVPSLGQHSDDVPESLKDAIVIKNLWSLEDVKKLIAKNATLESAIN